MLDFVFWGLLIWERNMLIRLLEHASEELELSEKLVPVSLPDHPLDESPMGLLPRPAERKLSNTKSGRKKTKLGACRVFAIGYNRPNPLKWIWWEFHSNVGKTVGEQLRALYSRVPVWILLAKWDGTGQTWRIDLYHILGEKQLDALLKKHEALSKEEVTPKLVEEASSRIRGGAGQLYERVAS